MFFIGVPCVLMAEEDLFVKQRTLDFGKSARRQTVAQLTSWPSLMERAGIALVWHAPA
jgi:hypothetical protein